MTTKDKSLERLHDYIRTRYERHTLLKLQLEAATKELSQLGVRLGDPLNLTRLPIDIHLVEKVEEALKKGGKNVKSLQKELGIFDYAEMTRTRKALMAAGVIRETENYQGTNATYIELVQEEELVSEGGLTEDATFGAEPGREEQEATGAEPPAAKQEQTKKPAK